jgi:hypothetical protein
LDRIWILRVKSPERIADVKLGLPNPPIKRSCPAPTVISKAEPIRKTEEAESLPAPPTLEHLIAATYRNLNDKEEAELNEWLAELKLDKATFCTRLTRYKNQGDRVTDDFPLGWFVRCVLQHTR